METNRLSDSAVDEISIPIGSLDIRMLAPRRLEESDSRISFWWGITSAAIALARHVEGSGSLLGRRIVELGCGLGLAGITAGLCGAEVLFTDYVPEALEFARKNAQLNGLTDQTIESALLDWEEPGEIEPFSIVLGSEILYDYFFHGSLIRLLQTILEPSGTIILADRKRLVVTRFLGRLTDAGFRCVETRSQVAFAGFPEQEISIFTLDKL
ncbi:MAG: class I SAM-dependent methyltransferase [Desulfomonilaceae bacterium]